MKQEVIVEISYSISSKNGFTEKEAAEIVKRSMRHGVRWEEFNRSEKTTEENNCS